MLFHGKLSIPDNEKGARWLIQEVFAHIEFPFIIAGMDPSSDLKELAARYEHITIVENPDETTMSNLIRDAHANILVSFQASGVKLKLINALFRGRFCIVNEAMVRGTGLESYCHVRNSPRDMRQTIEALSNMLFEHSRIESRQHLLETEYSNLENAKKLIGLLKFDNSKKINY
jgi:hypothetical protein